MSKRYFKIELNGYGGEFTMGRVNQDFVEYWQDRDSDELIEHLNGLEWEDEYMMDPDSPEVCEDFCYIYECDDFAHISSAYGDSGYWVTEVKLKDDSCWNEETQSVDEPLENETDVDEGAKHDFSFGTFGREVFMCDPDTEGDLEPVLCYHSCEKGNFGIAYVVTDGEDFNPDLVSVSTAETEYGEFIETLWYGEKQLELCYDWADTNGKATYVSVGYVNPKWIDEYDEEEILENIRDHLEHSEE